MTWEIAFVLTVGGGAVLFIGLNVLMGIISGASFWETVAVAVVILAALAVVIGFAFGVAEMWEAVP